jgi:ElaB/YqjD/DUF883 family membrane-anchored ribosome-binding protein
MAEERELRQDLNTLKEDISKLRSDLSELAQKLLNIGKSEAGVTKDKLLERGRKTVETVGQKIEEKPLISLLIAFIVGLLLMSRVFKRCSKDQSEENPR